jgi:hypothetical protein
VTQPISTFLPFPSAKLAQASAAKPLHSNPDYLPRSSPDKKATATAFAYAVTAVLSTGYGTANAESMYTDCDFCGKTAILSKRDKQMPRLSNCCG